MENKEIVTRLNEIADFGGNGMIRPKDALAQVCGALRKLTYDLDPPPSLDEDTKVKKAKAKE